MHNVKKAQTLQAAATDLMAVAPGAAAIRFPGRVVGGAEDLPEEIGEAGTHQVTPIFRE